jgi:hypothetical protein
MHKKIIQFENIIQIQVDAPSHKDTHIHHMKLNTYKYISYNLVHAHCLNLPTMQVK